MEARTHLEEFYHLLKDNDYTFSNDIQNKYEELIEDELKKFKMMNNMLDLINNK